jgi:CubicO group peptidase (beta-lactamase class C family)
LRSIAYGPDGAWVLLGDGFGSWHGNVPAGLAKVLRDAAQQRNLVRCVAFSGHDWICLTDHGWWSSNDNLPSSRAIAAAYRQKTIPKWLAISPEPYDFARNTPTSYLDAIVARSGIKGDTPGVGVLVIDHGKVLLEKCYGLARLRDKRPITPETTFELASCSKQFTGAAILHLQEQGRLSIDDPVRQYLPELPVYEKNHPIRISHLAHHTSGLREYFEFPDVKGKHPDYLTNDDHVGLFARERTKFPRPVDLRRR